MKTKDYGVNFNVNARRSAFWPAFICVVIAFFGLRSGSVSASEQRSPFGIEVKQVSAAPTPALKIDFTIPEDCVLYFERLHFLNEAGDELTPSKLPDPVLEVDKATGKEKKVYDRNFSAELPIASLMNSPLVVKFQGCSNGSCYFPEKRTFALSSNMDFAEILPDEEPAPAELEKPVGDWAKEMHDYKVCARQSGYMPAKKFLAFLDRAATGQDDADDPLAGFKKKGFVATLLLIVLGGVLLNLTPCILPMIPINLAIIGAGSAATSRVSGFKNGAVYGLGMALAYGTLGLGVVLTGSKFGTLNSSVWFNIAIAVVFVVLGLGMFDVINIDLSRFSSGIGPQSAHSAAGGFIKNAIIFVMGVMAALLAGACVAPVVISVMLLAAGIYNKGNMAGLLLPFLLGTGMALPWPLAGAGLGFLPKPGKWMKFVKHGFGVLIMIFGLYYLYLGWEAYGARKDSTALADAPPGTTPASVKKNPDKELAEGLRLGRETGKPVVIDFHASWCKNCSAMDETVFNRSEVKKRLQDFVLVRYDAENPGKQPAKQLLDHFGVLGLPSYIVLTTSK